MQAYCTIVYSGAQLMIKIIAYCTIVYSGAQLMIYCQICSGCLVILLNRGTLCQIWSGDFIKNEVLKVLLFSYFIWKNLLLL